MTRLHSNSILTHAETRIAIGYTEGLIGKEIADECGVSYNTVVKHTQNIYNKTGIRRSTNALVAWFLSTNYGIDISELKRRFESAALLLVLFMGMLSGNHNDALRGQRTPTRIAARRAMSRKGKDEHTYYIQ